MKDVEWFGPFDTTGYGIWGRGLVMNLLSSGKYRVKIIPRREKSMSKNDPLYPLMRLNVQDPIKIYNYIPTFQLPEDAGLCTCTELRTPPREQHDHLQNANFIIALSSFSQRSFRRVVSNDEKVFKVNFPFFREKLKPNKSITFPNIPDSAYKFLFVGRVDVRKNIQMLIKAFEEEFEKESKDDVVLLLKIHSKSYKIPLFINEVSTSNKIYWLDHYFKNMANLYAGVDAYVTADLGEGWGAPCTEAMLFGLPTIAPRHSGHLDYMNDENSWLVDVENDWREIGYRKDNKYEHLLPSTGLVKYPKIDSLKRQMRAVYEEFKDMGLVKRLRQEKIKKSIEIWEKVKPQTIQDQLDKCLTWVIEHD